MFFKGVNFGSEIYRLTPSGEKHLAILFALYEITKIWWVTSKPCNGKAISSTKNLRRKGTPLDLPLEDGMHKSNRKHML